MTNKKHDREYSTSEFAEALGVPTATVYSWLRSAKLRKPKTVKRGQLDVRVWSDSDLERAAALKLRLRRGRRSKSESGKNSEKEVLTSGRLLQLNQLLGWFEAEFTDSSPTNSIHDLQSAINSRLRDRKW